MARLIDWTCKCGHSEPDVMAEADDIHTCTSCGGDMEQDWLPRVRRNAQWDDNTSVMVHIHPGTGEVRYPGRHDAKVKEGFERKYLRSLDEVNKFERDHKVMVHTMHYDSNGRALDDKMTN